jgi:hypothetical protein
MKHLPLKGFFFQLFGTQSHFKVKIDCEIETQRIRLQVDGMKVRKENMMKEFRRLQV